MYDAGWGHEMQLIAKLEEIPAGGLKFSYKDGPFDEEGILLVADDGSVRAFKNLCRHLPMRLDEREPADYWDPSGKYLVCNSHGARFETEDGLCVAGPCKGSHLKILPLSVDNGEVFLDLSKMKSFLDG